MVPNADGFADHAGDDRPDADRLLDEAVTDPSTYDTRNLTSAHFHSAAAGVRGRRRSPGTLEAEVLNVLHNAHRELTPAQVKERLSDGATLSYSAVVTTLTRLHGKGVVTRRRAGRAFLYVAKSDSASLVAWRMNRLLDEQADHRPALTHFVAALSPGDEALIRQLLFDGPRDGRADLAADQPLRPGDGRSADPSAAAGH